MMVKEMGLETQTSDRELKDQQFWKTVPCTKKERKVMQGHGVRNPWLGLRDWDAAVGELKMLWKLTSSLMMKKYAYGTP